MEMEAKKNIELWLDEVLKARGWTRNQLSTAAGLASGTLTNIFSGDKGIGKGVSKKIAKALNIPEEVVFREAGLIKKNPDYDELTEKIVHLVSQMDEIDKNDVLQYAEVVLNRSKERDLVDDLMRRIKSLPREEAKEVMKRLLEDLRIIRERDGNSR